MSAGPWIEMRGPLMNPQTDFLAPKDQARSRTVTMAMRLFMAISMTAMMAAGAISTAEAQTPKPVAARSDAVLVKSLPGFQNGYADVNGTRLHYVIGGEGAPLVLLPGWPQTWWQFHKIMPTLAKSYRVIAVDLRGMGGSSKPPAGYDKKNMAKDIRELVQKLGYDKVHMAGHDIGAMVAFSYAANYPEATTKLALLDVPHPDDFFSQLTMVRRCRCDVIGCVSDKAALISWRRHSLHPWRTHNESAWPR